MAAAATATAPAAARSGRHPLALAPLRLLPPLLLLPAAPQLRPAAAQPVCGASGAFRPRCNFDPLEQGGAWPPSVVYNAVIAAPAGDRSWRLPRMEDGRPSALLLGSHSGRGISSSDFVPVVPPRESSWANTPEGEWTASVTSVAASGPSRELLELAGGNCALRGVSVYRPADRELAVRLNFEGCRTEESQEDVASAAVVVVVRRGASNGESGLVDWMCALMPHRVCWPPAPTTTTPETTTVAQPGSIGLEVRADYLPVGGGLCFRAPPAGRLRYGAPEVEEHPHASDIKECAVECLSRSTAALRVGGGVNCTAFAFSAVNPRRCLVYSGQGLPAPTAQTLQEEEEGGGWRCFAMQRAQGGAVDQPPASLMQPWGEEPTAEEAPEPTEPPETRTEATLQLQWELGTRCVQAVRQRLAPLVPACYPPFYWVTLGSGPQLGGSAPGGLPSAATRTQQVLGGAVLTINESVWDYLQQNLPVVESRHVEVDSTVTSDFVCVDIGGAGCCREQGAASSVIVGAAAGSSGGDDWWKYLLVAIVAAVLSSVATFYTMQAWAPRVSYSLVETDLYDPSKSKTIGTVAPEASFWWSWAGANEKRGYTPFPRV